MPRTASQPIKPDSFCVVNRLDWLVVAVKEDVKGHYHIHGTGAHGHGVVALPAHVDLQGDRMEPDLVSCPVWDTNINP